MRVIGSLFTLVVIGGIALIVIVGLMSSDHNKSATAAPTPTPTPYREEDESWVPMDSPSSEVEWDRTMREYYKRQGYPIKTVPSPTPYDPANLPLVRTKGEFWALPEGALYRCAYDNQIHRKPIDYAPSWETNK